MNIFLHELKAYRKSTILWTFSLSALVIIFLSIYPAFTKDVALMKKMLEGYPIELRLALGMVMDNFFSLVGFYSFIFLYVKLCGSIQAMNIGTSIISKEVRDKTADFLLSKPISRRTIMTAKLLAALTSIIVSDAVYLIVACVMASVVKTEPYSVKIFLMISVTLFFIQLMFMSLGVLVSVIVPKIKSVISVSLGVVFGFFILNMFNSVFGEKAIRFLTPFKYFDTAYIIQNSAYETPYVIVGLVFVIAAIWASYFIYAKKDIHAV